jgi:hypothetical protein
VLGFIRLAEKRPELEAAERVRRLVGVAPLLCYLKVLDDRGFTVSLWCGGGAAGGASAVTEFVMFIITFGNHRAGRVGMSLVTPCTWGPGPCGGAHVRESAVLWEFKDRIEKAGQWLGAGVTLGLVLWRLGSWRPTLMQNSHLLNHCMSTTGGSAAEP